MNGRNTMMNPPAAKFANNPDHAIPIANPTAARIAAKLVVSIPQYPRMAITRMIFSVTVINDPT
ncbi:hypothetical protein D3C84_1178280 [compost metagenome]